MFRSGRALVSAMFAVCCLPASGQIEGSAAPGRPFLLVVNQTDHNISFMDPVVGRQALTVDVAGITGHEAMATPDGLRAFVPIYGNSGVGKPGTDGRSIAVIDLARHTLAGTIDFDHGVRPHCAVYDPKRNLVYVTTELDQTVSVIDPQTLKVVGAIPTGQEQSHMLAVSHDGRFGYTANVGPGTVSVLDLETRKTVKVIPISPQVQRISISADDRTVFTADQTQPRLALIDTATNRLSRWVSLPAVAYGTAATPDGKWLLVTMRSAAQVAVLNLKTLTVERTIAVPKIPTEVLVRSDGKVAYVSGDDKVATIDLEDWSVRTVMAAGKGADGLAWVPGAGTSSVARK